MIPGLDSKDETMAGSMTLFSLLVLAFYLLKPFDKNIMLISSSIIIVAVLIVTLYYCIKATRLYGIKSHEGKFWNKIVWMMLVMALGIAASELLDYGTDFFALSALVGFAIAFWAGIERLIRGGLKPSIRDLLNVAVIELLAISLITILTVYVFNLPEISFDYGDYVLESLVILIGLAATYMMLLLGQLMGGHLSRAWYLLGAGATIFTVKYNLMLILTATDMNYQFMFLDAFDAIALLLVAFTAYYQRKKHLEMIEGFF